MGVRGQRRPGRVVGIVAGAAMLLGAVGLLDSAPGAAAPGTSDWVMVDAGVGHTCGIRTSGRLYCWGIDDQGQAGDGAPTTGNTTPTEVVGGHTDWTTVSAGDFHTCGRRMNGRLYCWGIDDNGELGDGGGSADQPAPVEVAGGFTDWTSVAAGRFHTCGRRSTGQLYCWGDDTSGQLGDGGGNTPMTTPVQVAGGRTDWAGVAVGGEHTCARRTNRTLFCWGRDTNGQVGNGGTNTDRPVPTQVAGGHTDWTTVAAGYNHTCGRRASGRLYCWGRDNGGQVGDGGTNTDRGVPTEVAGGLTTWTAVSAGTGFTCARRGGLGFCWGSDGFGQVGNGFPLAQRTTPTQIASFFGDWTLISAGGYHACARRATGAVQCWGDDGSGELGNGPDPTDRATPTPIWG